MKTRVLVCVCALVAVLSSCNRDPKVVSHSYVETGNRFFKNGKIKQARIMYARALTRDRMNGEAYYRLGLVEQDLGNPVGALRNFQRAVELQPDNTDAHGKLANLYLLAYVMEPRHSKQWVTEMQGLGEKLLKKDPKSYEGLRIQGYVRLANRDLKGAIESFKSANQSKPGQSELIVSLVQALSADNQFEEGEKLARGLIAANKSNPQAYDILYLEYMRRSQTAQAEAIYKEKAAANPKEIDYALQLANHYFLMRDRPQVDAVLKQITVDFKDNPTMREKVGSFYFRFRDFQLAYNQYELGSKEQPKRTARFQTAMVECLVAQNRRNEATQLLETILKADAKNDQALAMRAALMLQTGNKENIDRAVIEMQGLVSRMGDNPVLRFNYGRALLTRGEVEQAAIQFQEAAKLRRDYVLPRLALAEISFNKGETARTVEFTDQVLQIDPQNPLARLIKARAQYRLGDSVKAREELNSILKTNPRLLDAQFQLAVLDLAEKNYKAADAVFERLYRETGDTRALFALSDSMVSQKRIDEVLRMLQAELDKNPRRADLRLALGNSAAASGRLDIATEQFQKVIEQAPNSGDAYLRLGEVARLQGNLPKATENFRKASQYLPNDFRPALQLAILLDVTGDKKGAMPVYEQVLKMKPDQEIALNNLAFLLAESGSDLDRALGMAERAKRKLPDATDVADTLGWIYLKKNLSDSALQVFQDIVRKRPDNPTYRYHLALALFQKGDKIQARKEAALALQNKPTKDDESRIRDLISRLG